MQIRWMEDEPLNTPADIVTLEQINSMGQPEFVESLGGIFEHSPWVAEGAYSERPFESVQQLHGHYGGNGAEGGT